MVATNLKTNTQSETITQLYIDYNTDYIYWTEEQVIDGIKWSYIKKYVFRQIAPVLPRYFGHNPSIYIF